MNIYDFPITGNQYPKVVPVFIEVSQNSNVKYEWDNEKGVLILDRILHSSVVYPYNYGFIPQTLCGDGDPLDILVISSQPLQPGTMVNVRPICYMDMTDEKGRDEKVVGVVEKDPYYTDVYTMGDLAAHTFTRIKDFFNIYKRLEPNKWVKVGDWYDTDTTLDLVRSTHEEYISMKDEECK